MIYDFRNGRFIENSEGNIRYFKNDSHGGHAEEHKREMEEIAQRVFREQYQEMIQDINEMICIAQYQAYEQALKDVINVIEYDIESIISIGIDGCRDLYFDKKTQKFISDQIMKNIEKELKGKHFRK